VPSRFRRSFTTRLRHCFDAHERQSCAQRSTRAFWRGLPCFSSRCFFQSNSIGQWIHAWVCAGAPRCAGYFHIHIACPQSSVARIARVSPCSDFHLVCAARFNPSGARSTPASGERRSSPGIYTPTDWFPFHPACSFVAVPQLLAPPRNLRRTFRPRNKNGAPPAPQRPRNILAPGFVLLNIEIADYFTKSGDYEITFHIHRGTSFPSDMITASPWAFCFGCCLDRRDSEAAQGRARLLRPLPSPTGALVLLKALFSTISPASSTSTVIAALISVAIVTLSTTQLHPPRPNRLVKGPPKWI